MLSVAPFLQFTCLLMAGILCHGKLPFYSDYFLLTMFLLVCFSGIAGLYFLKNKQYVPVIWILSVTCFLLGFTGAGLQYREMKRQEATVIVPYEGYIAIIKTLPEKRVESFRHEAEITHLIRSGEQEQFSGRALIQVPADTDEMLMPGSIIRVNQQLKKPMGSMNPGSFDYSAYLSDQGIYFVDYIRKGQFFLLGNNRNIFNPVSWSYTVSEKADEIFRACIQDDDAYGLVKAMILGRRDDLRSELVDAFTISGAVHILSVSGLHVGIFFVVIQYLLGWLRRYRYGRFIQLALLSFMLMFYGLMTGMPPSVERSVIMCMILAVAGTFLKNQVSLNTLGIAAFVILLTDPMAVYSIGFQLSFLAMVGLMVFSKPFEQLIESRNKPVRYIWSMMAATLAAQLTTLPLTLYYFHQFPTWFLLVNPLVIAISALLLPAAFLLLAISWLPVGFVVSTVAFVVTCTAVLTNYAVTIPAFLPVPVIENITFDFIQMLMLLIFILFFGWYGLYKKRGEAVPWIFYFCIVFSGYSVFQQWITPEDSRLVIHSVRNTRLISILDKGHLFLVSSEVLSDKEYQYTLKDYAVRQQVRRQTYILPGQQARGNGWQIEWEEGEPVIQYFNKGIFPGPAKATGGEAILIPSVSPDSFDKGALSKIQHAILDNRLSYRQRMNWRNFLKENSIGFSDLQETGAYTVHK